jgi:hypothetical protein
MRNHDIEYPEIEAHELFGILAADSADVSALQTYLAQSPKTLNE